MLIKFALVAWWLLVAAAALWYLCRRHPGLWCFIHKHDGVPLKRIGSQSFLVMCKRCGDLLLAQRTPLGTSYTQASRTLLDFEDYTVDEEEREPEAKHR